MGKYGQGELKLKTLIDLIRDRLIVDEDTGMMYGFDFDDYIELVKVKNSRSNLGFGEEIEQIFTDLHFYQKDELIYLHRYIIAQAQQAKFKEKARLVVMDTIVKQVYVLKSKKEIGTQAEKKLLSDQDWNELMVFSASNPDQDKLYEKIRELNLPEERIKAISIYLAKEQVKMNVKAKSQCILKITISEEEKSEQLL